VSKTRAEELKVKSRDIQSRLRNVENEIKVLLSGLTGSDMAAVQTAQPPPEEVKRLEALRQRIIGERKRVEKEIQSLEDRIRQLKFWLTIESVGGISTGTLAMSSVYLFSSIFNGLPFIYWYSFLILAAIAFLPFLVSTLIKLKQYHWIWILTIMVGVPASLNVVPINDKFFTLAFQLFPLFMFYAYCGILRWVVDSWLEY
jgi:hypothetical protein